MALLIASHANAVIDLDAKGSASGDVLTFSKEYLTLSSDAPARFFSVGDVENGTGLWTRVALGEARFLALDGKIWTRYDINEHLAFRGTAPRLFLRRGSRDTPPSPRDLIPGGVEAYNADTFAVDRFLVFDLDLPEDAQPLRATDTLELDFNQVVATSGEEGGVVRVRTFADGIDAVTEERARLLDESGTVLKVAQTVSINPIRVRRRARASTGFLQFGDGFRVPIAGFEVNINAEHRQPNGSVVGTELADFNVDVEKSVSMFSSEGGFAFSALEDWTLERGQGDGVRCKGERPGTEESEESPADSPTATVSSDPIHAVEFGPDNVNYPVGPVTSIVAEGAWYLCAAVPEDNEEVLPLEDYHLTLTLEPGSYRRAFQPSGVMEALSGTIWRDGTSVEIPYLTTSDRHEQRIVMVSRHPRRKVDYVLVVQPWDGGTANPRVVKGEISPNGPTSIDFGTVTKLTGTDEASATLALVSFPERIDVATSLLSSVDRSTDTVVLHRGLDISGAFVDEQGRTIVHVPYLTTDEAYVQRLIIYNRQRRDVDYVLTVHPEEDGRARPAVIEGTVGDRELTVIRVPAVTTITGTEVASATLQIESVPGKIDVATTIVTKADGSTDTVSLHRGQIDR